MRIRLDEPSPSEPGNPESHHYTFRCLECGGLLADHPCLIAPDCYGEASPAHGGSHKCERRRHDEVVYGGRYHMENWHHSNPDRRRRLVP